MLSTIIYCDIDGCIRNLVGAIDRLYKETFMEDPPASPDYDLELRYPLWGKDAYDVVFREYVDRLFGHDAEPYEGAVEALNWLHNQEGVTVKFLSKQDGARKGITDDWLDRVGVDSTIERIYIDKISKGEYLLWSDIDFLDYSVLLLDDSPDELASVLPIDGVTPVVVMREWNAEFRSQDNYYEIENITLDTVKYLIHWEDQDDDT